LYLAGAQRIITVDLKVMMKPELTRRCTQVIGAQLGAIAAISGRTPQEVSADHANLSQRLDAGADLAAATQGKIQYLAPADARRTKLAPKSVDVVFSNNVLEHVPAEDIRGMLRESVRILRPGGIVFHSVNCGDHYSYVDSSVNQLNYLRFSEAQWQKWNNHYLYQNRLRACDFVRLAVEAGLEIIINTAQPTPQRLEQLRHIPVAGCFSGYTPEELCITTVAYVGRKPSAVALLAADAATLPAAFPS